MDQAGGWQPRVASSARPSSARPSMSSSVQARSKWASIRERGWISFAPAACPRAAYRDIRDKHGYTTDRTPNHHGTGAGEPAASGRLALCRRDPR